MDLELDAPRQLIDVLLPAARKEYISAWEFLVDPTHRADRRRVGRETALRYADQNEAAAELLRARAAKSEGEDRADLIHLAEQAERLVVGLRKLATLSPHGVKTATDVRPDGVGCGRRFRDPDRQPGAVVASRATPVKPRSKDRDRGKGRDRDRDSFR